MTATGIFFLRLFVVVVVVCFVFVFFLAQDPKWLTFVFVIYTMYFCVSFLKFKNGCSS